MPAMTLVDAPVGCVGGPEGVGKFTTGKRVDAIGSVMGKSSTTRHRHLAALQGPARC